MKYRRVVITRKGGPEALQVIEEDLPQPKPGEVRVKTLTAGVAFADILIREGLFPGLPRRPFTPGFDLVGVVEAVGEGVVSAAPGQRVAALTRFGGYAEYQCVPAAELVPVPEGIDPAEAVCLVLNYVTAYQLLHRAARVQAGEQVLVHGAGGGVGTALLQLGKLANLRMYGTASTGKQDLVASLGATPIDYKKEDFVERVRRLTGEGVDVALDPIGGVHWWQSYRALRKGGRLVPYGVSSLYYEGMLKGVLGIPLLVLLKFVPDGKHILWMYGVTAKPHSSPASCREDLATLLDLLAQGKIRPIIGARIPLVEAARAHELLGKSAVSGKIVLICNP